LVFACSRGLGFHVVMKTIWGWGSKIKSSRVNAEKISEGHAMSKREDANNTFRPSDSPLSEHEKEQIALRKNMARLRELRLARESASKQEEAATRSDPKKKPKKRAT
jgi:hypothetical protein